MSTTLPIKDEALLKEFKGYYLEIQPNPRNYLLIIMGLNTALRIGDILSLRWGDIYDFRNKSLKKHLKVTEQKTKKMNCIMLNENIIMALNVYWQDNSQSAIYPVMPLFHGQRSDDPLSRYQAYRIIRQAAAAVGAVEHISCHSLRKTFGYHAWKQGIPPAMLMKIYNHSSFEITRQYLCIDQEDKDMVFQNIIL